MAEDKNNILQQAAQGLFRSISSGIGSTVQTIARDTNSNRKALSTIDNNFSKAVKKLDSVNKNITEQLQRNKFSNLESQFERSRDHTDASLDRLENAINNLLGALGGSAGNAAGGGGGLPYMPPPGGGRTSPEGGGQRRNDGPRTGTKPVRPGSVSTGRRGPTAAEVEGIRRSAASRVNNYSPGQSRTAPEGRRGPTAAETQALRNRGAASPVSNYRPGQPPSLFSENVKQSTQPPKPGTAPRAPKYAPGTGGRFRDPATGRFVKTPSYGVSSVRRTSAAPYDPLGSFKPGGQAAGIYDPLGSFKPGAPQQGGVGSLSNVRPGTVPRIPTAMDVAYKIVGKADAIAGKAMIPIAAGLETWAGFNEYIQYRMQYESGQINSEQFSSEVNRIVAKYPARFLSGLGAGMIGAAWGQALVPNRWAKMGFGAAGGILGYMAGNVLAGNAVDILAGKTTIRDAIYNETGIDLGRGAQNQEYSNEVYNYSSSEFRDTLAKKQSEGFVATPQTHYLGGMIGGAPPSAARKAGESMYGGEGDVEASPSEGISSRGMSSGTVDLNQFLDASKRGTDHATGLNPQFAGPLSQMLSEARQAGMNIQIGSGYRSIQRQKELWNNALMKYGSPSAARRWVAPPGRSKHNFGTAADLWVNGRKLGSPGTERETQWAHANAGKYGLGFRMGHEPWHIEPGSGGFYNEQNLPMGAGLGSMEGNVPNAPWGMGQGVGSGYSSFAAGSSMIPGAQYGLSNLPFGVQNLPSPLQGIIGSMFGGGFGMMGSLGGVFGSLMTLGNMMSSFGGMFGSNNKPHKLESNEARTALTGAKSSSPKSVPERAVMMRRSERSNQPMQTSSMSDPITVGAPKQKDNNSKNTTLKNMMAHFEESISRANFSINQYITSEQNPSSGLA